MTISPSNLNLQDPDAVRDLFDRAAEASYSCDFRQGSVLDLPREGQLVVSGDLHDRRDHLEKMLHVADLDASPSNHLLLQEVIHSDHLINDMDLSYRGFAQIAQLVTERPRQVHLILGNHELAQWHGHGVRKGSVSSIEAFNRGLEYVFREDAEDVLEAINRFIRSIPLAIRCANGVMCTHSLPGPRVLSRFDPTVIDRIPTEEDLARLSGSAYMLVWGRQLDQRAADELAAQWSAKIFVLGHQPTEVGYEPYGDTMLVLNSDHEQGAILPVDLTRDYTRDELLMACLPLNAVR